MYVICCHDYLCPDEWVILVLLFSLRLLYTVSVDNTILLNKGKHKNIFLLMYFSPESFLSNLQYYLIIIQTVCVDTEHFINISA